MTIVQLDVEDLARLDEEITNWQIHNSFTSSTTAFPAGGAQMNVVNEQDGSFVASRPKVHNSPFKPISYTPVQTPGPIKNVEYSFSRAHGQHSPLYGHDDDPLGLHANNVIENAIYATPLRSELEHLDGNFGIPQEIMHGHEDGVSVNHQLELEQMAAIARLSIDDDEQDSFITQQSPVDNNNHLDYLNAGDREPDTFAEHFKGSQMEQEFPVIEPPAPLVSSPVQDHLDQESDDNLQLLIDEIERLKEEKVQMKRQFEAEKQRLQSHFAKQGVSLASLKSQLEKESHMDLIQLKKEILQQRELQLEAIRQEMKVERETIEMQMQEQLVIKEQEWHQEKQDLLCQIDALKHENGEVKDKLTNNDSEVKLTSDGECQTDDVCSSSPHVQISKLRELNAELEEKQTDMLMQLSQQETIISEKTDEIVNIRDEMAELQRKCADYEMKLAKYKRRSVPDPFACISINLEDGGEEGKENLQTDASEEEIEKRYAKAYETAVEHLKESYAAMTAKLKTKTEKAHTEAVTRVRKELERVLQDTESSLLKERSHALALSKQVEWLERELEKDRDKHQQMMNDLKLQYLNTLRQMRDDVAKSKQRSVERVKEAWLKKKLELDQAWQKKLDEMAIGKRGTEKKSPAVSTTTSSSRPIFK